MSKLLFKKVTVSFLANILLTVMILNPLNAKAATAEEFAATLEKLTISLVAIGNAVAASDFLSDSERLGLMTQLIAISTEIQRIRKESSLGIQPVEIPLTSEKNKITAEKAGLQRIVIYYDFKNNLIKTSEVYRSGIKTNSPSLPELTNQSDFAGRLAQLKQLIAVNISNGRKIKYEDVKKLIFVTARNPLQDKIIASGSAEAKYLAEQFAKNSIVNKIKILPGKGLGQIEIYTDQDEKLVLKLEQEAEENNFEGRVAKDTWSYTYEFYALTLLDIEAEKNAINPLLLIKSTPTATLRSSVIGISEAEIKKFLVSIFNEVPFTSRISNFDNRLLKFIAKNSTHYLIEANDRNYSYAARDCFTGTDKAVIDEFITYVLNGLGAQYDNVPAASQYISPIIVNHNDGAVSTCSKSTIF